MKSFVDALRYELPEPEGAELVRPRSNNGARVLRATRRGPDQAAQMEPGLNILEESLPSSYHSRAAWTTCEPQRRLPAGDADVALASCDDITSAPSEQPTDLDYSRAGLKRNHVVCFMVPPLCEEAISVDARLMADVSAAA